MGVKPDKQNRRSIRLKGYDYSQKGAYFVTICTHNRKCILGHVESRNIRLNGIGLMVQKAWLELPLYYKEIDIDEFVIMPNHLHGIILIVGAGPRACPKDGVNKGQPQGVAPTKALSLPDVMYSFKSLTTKRYIDGVENKSWEAFDRHFWQRNYYEHVIRNEDDLNEIREYVSNNPLKWELDKENPNNYKCSIN